jgi:hypothetical protein
MLNFGKAVRLILVATAPVLAVAQAPQVRPAPQARPATSPAAGSTTGATAAPATRPQQPDPNSKRFVTSDNFFHARPKPQPASNAQPTDAQPSVPRPAAVRNTPPLQPRPAMPQAIHPAVASVPSLSAPQPSATLPVLITPSPAKGSIHEGSAAVDYAQGQLTVVSESAPLGAVLKLVAAKTGAVVDLAPELQNEPVVAQLGPSPVREVLTALLDSPRVDYIVMGTGDDSGRVQRIVVRTRQTFGRVAMAAVRPPQPRQEEAEEETKLDENGHLAGGPAPADPKMTQEQLMENWRKAREVQRLAEIKQQEQDRENDKTQPQMEPQPEPQPEPPQPDNPPQK